MLPAAFIAGPGFQSAQWRELRFDIDPAVAPDILGIMTDMSALGDASVDAIFSSHNIEHLYPHEVPVALKEFIRVLKPDGFAVMTCPDLLSTAEMIATLQAAGFRSVAGGRRQRAFDMWVIACKEPLSDDALFQRAAEHFPFADRPALAMDPLVSGSRHPPLWSAAETVQTALITALQKKSAMADRAE